MKTTLSVIGFLVVTVFGVREFQDPGSSMRDVLTIRRLFTIPSGATFTLAGTTTNTGTFSTTNVKTSGGLLATRDSFTTTGATKVVTIASAGIADVFVVSHRTYTYSATPDTGSSPYRAQVDSTGYVTINRTKLTPASTLKSGAHFDLVRIDK